MPLSEFSVAGDTRLVRHEGCVYKVKVVLFDSSSPQLQRQEVRSAFHKEIQDVLAAVIFKVEAEIDERLMEKKIRTQHFVVTPQLKRWKTGEQLGFTLHGRELKVLTKQILLHVTCRDHSHQNRLRRVPGGSHSAPNKDQDPRPSTSTSTSAYRPATSPGGNAAASTHQQGTADHPAYRPATSPGGNAAASTHQQGTADHPHYGGRKSDHHHHHHHGGGYRGMEKKRGAEDKAVSPSAAEDKAVSPSAAEMRNSINSASTFNTTNNNNNKNRRSSPRKESADRNSHHRSSPRKETADRNSHHRSSPCKESADRNSHHRSSPCKGSADRNSHHRSSSRKESDDRNSKKSSSPHKETADRNSNKSSSQKEAAANANTNISRKYSCLLAQTTATARTQAQAQKTRSHNSSSNNNDKTDDLPRKRVVLEQHAVDSAGLGTGDPNPNPKAPRPEASSAAATAARSSHSQQPIENASVKDAATACDDSRVVASSQNRGAATTNTRPTRTLIPIKHSGPSSSSNPSKRQNPEKGAAAPKHTTTTTTTKTTTTDRSDSPDRGKSTKSVQPDRIVVHASPNRTRSGAGQQKSSHPDASSDHNHHSKQSQTGQKSPQKKPQKLPQKSLQKSPQKLPQKSPQKSPNHARATRSKQLEDNNNIRSPRQPVSSNNNNGCSPRQSVSSNNKKKKGDDRGPTTSSSLSWLLDSSPLRKRKRPAVETERGSDNRERPGRETETGETETGAGDTRKRLRLRETETGAHSRERSGGETETARTTTRSRQAPTATREDIAQLRATRQLSPASQQLRQHRQQHQQQQKQQIRQQQQQQQEQRRQRREGQQRQQGPGRSRSEVGLFDLRRSVRLARLTLSTLRRRSVTQTVQRSGLNEELRLKSLGTRAILESSRRGQTQARRKTGTKTPNTTTPAPQVLQSFQQKDRHQVEMADIQEEQKLQSMASSSQQQQQQQDQDASQDQNPDSQPRGTKRSGGLLSTLTGGLVAPVKKAFRSSHSDD